MRRLALFVIGLAVIGLGVFWTLSAPERLPADALAGIEGDAEKGARVFYAAGCASCHAAPEAEGDEKLILAGGMRFPSPFGTFIAPNISPDETHGIGDWTAQELADAMIHGTSPEGAHYYPAFPYGSYGRLATHPEGLKEIAHLHAFLQTLPPSSAPNAAHEVGFPFNIRRGLGLWKLVFANEGWVSSVPGDDAQLERGRTLVEALGHCGECHTPRNAVGAPLNGQWLAGAANPSGEGRIPGIDEMNWSARDIAYYLETGFTPDFDSAGGHMAAVIENTSQLPEEDRAAIAAYLKAVSQP
ncbi:diacylglycerol kinase [Rhodobacteraceae bacterium 63075]|nr:diacylglycerol kinase [Rhodobacteraceae bacterium 63075]